MADPRPPLTEPRALVRAFIAHRKAREHQILGCIRRGADTIPAMVRIIYADVSTGLHAAAARMVLAHVEHMVETGRITCDGPPRMDAVYEPGPVGG